jgi:hypothetical protein
VGSENTDMALPTARAWPLCGYAPGNYTGHCRVCGLLFDGAKRSFMCLDCAVRSVNTTVERGVATRAAAIELHDTVTLWAEYGGPTLPPAVSAALAKLFSALKRQDEVFGDPA